MTVAFGEVVRVAALKRSACLPGPRMRGSVPRMAFPRRLLVEGEELVLDLRPHPVALVLPSIATSSSVGVGIWLVTLVDGTSRGW